MFDLHLNNITEQFEVGLGIHIVKRNQHNMQLINVTVWKLSSRKWMQNKREMQ